MRDTSGFTVVESMIALVVLSIGLLAIAKMQIYAIKLNSSSLMLSDSVSISQSKMEEIMNMSYNSGDLDDNQPDTGVFTLHTDQNPPDGYSITWEVDENSPSINTKTIKLNIKRIHKDGEKDIAFEFIKGNF